MRKEVLFAVIGGLGFGLVIAFGIWRANSAITKTAAEDEIKIINTSPSPTANVKIALAKPEDESIQTESRVTLSGITKPESLIIVSGENKDYLAKSIANGSFNIDVDLTPGINQIIVSVEDKNGTNPESTNVTLVYSKEFGKTTSVTLDPAPDSTKEADDIREKIKEKVQAALMSPRAFLGTITDKTSGSLELKTEAGEIKQAGVSEADVAVINAVKAPKEVKFADIAIGDFIVAMGYKNGNGVLDTKRILIIPPLAEPERKIISGQVSDVTKKDITVGDTKAAVDKTTGVFSYKDSALTKIAFGTISGNDTVLLVADTSKSTPLARSIFLIAK